VWIKKFLLYCSKKTLTKYKVQAASIMSFNSVISISKYFLMYRILNFHDNAEMENYVHVRLINSI
jgi:hypothetical protein